MVTTIEIVICDICGCELNKLNNDEFYGRGKLEFSSNINGLDEFRRLPPPLPLNLINARQFISIRPPH